MVIRTVQVLLQFNNNDGKTRLVGYFVGLLYISVSSTNAAANFHSRVGWFPSATLLDLCLVADVF